MKGLGNKLRNLRIKHGHTLQQLGEKLNFNYSNLSKIERELRSPSIDFLQEVAILYDVPLSYFFEEEIDTPFKEIGEEWVLFANEMNEKGITPDELRTIFEILKKNN